ncbi:unnamed protein product [Rotaria socialis]
METVESCHTKFGVLISLQIPSIACYIGLVYHMLSSRHNLQKLRNHTAISMLFVGFIAVIMGLSMILNFLQTGTLKLGTGAYCRVWNFIDLLLYALLSILMLLTSIERHILIFHKQQILNAQRKRFYVHYIPLACIFGYLIFFLYLNRFHPSMRKSIRLQSSGLCWSICFVIDTPVLGVFDQLAHTIVPSILIFIANICLLLRALWQKHYHMRQAI